MTELLILGATGNIGSEIVRQAVARDVPVRAASRQPERARQGMPERTEVVKFDFSDSDTFAPALTGIHQLFLIAPHQQPVPSVRRLLDTALASDVRRIVMSSGRTTGDIAQKPLHRVEELVQKSGIAWTILRPGWFMQNFSGWIGGKTIPEQNAIYLPAGSSYTAFVDVRDIAAVALRTLLNSGHDGKIYELTGEEALSHYEVAEKISAVARRPIHYHALSDGAFADKMRQLGWSEANIRHTLMLYELVRTGKEAAVTDDVETILHRMPISFDEFAADYQNAWDTDDLPIDSSDADL